MKKILILTLIFTLFVTPMALPEEAATPEPTGDEAISRQATTITSEKLRMDLGKRVGIFTGDVKVMNPRFNLTSNEVLVYFSEDNKPEKFVAKGEVNIEHNKRKATARQADYSVVERKIILTGDPIVMEDQNRVSGKIITIYPDSDRMDVEGRTTVQIFP